VEQEACPLNLAPTSSTTVMLVLGDALAMVLLEARGFRREDFARFHPGGRLGRTLLMRVRQIMRGEDQMALVRPDMAVREVLHEMSSRRAGAAIVVDDGGKLLGIFTHSDFARHYHVLQDSCFDYVALLTPDEQYYVGIDMPSAMHPQTLVCSEMNGKPLPMNPGFPLMLIIPSKYGIKSLKRIGIMYFSNTRPPDYWRKEDMIIIRTMNENGLACISVYVARNKDKAQSY